MEYEFDEEYFDDVSDLAKDFIDKFLVKNQRFVFCSLKFQGKDFTRIDYKLCFTQLVFTVLFRSIWLWN